MEHGLLISPAEGHDMGELRKKIAVRLAVLAVAVLLLALQVVALL